MRPHGDDVHDATPAEAMPESCSPIEQDGCAPGEKCTWILYGNAPGRIGCVPAGSAAFGSACHELAGGYDDCVAGALCGLRADIEPV